MEDLKFISNYKHDKTLRQSFNQLASLTFGIDFERWYSLNLWKGEYRCYSFAHNNQVVSNVSASRLDLLINNSHCTAVQIGTVMTHPDYRKKGLAKKLLNTVIEEYKNKSDIIYLFPEDDAMDLYNKFGFTPANDYIFSIDADFSPEVSDSRCLSITDSNDLKLIKSLNSKRVLSGIFDTIESNILIWYCTYAFRDYIHYFPDRDIIIIYKREGENLHIFDIISCSETALSDLLPAISAKETKKAFFYFTPFFHDIKPLDMARTLNEKILYLSSSFRLPDIFAHPVTSHA